MSEERTNLSELARRRGLFFPANEAYGGTAGFYVYGPAGAAVKRNVEDAWRDRFAVREGNMEIDAPTVMPEPVFEASGHLDGFDDMLVECAACGESHRADHLVEGATDIEDAESMAPEAVGDLIAEHDIACPSCGESLAGEPVTEFNLMFGTNIGPGEGAPGYLRPETAQGIFVEFPRLKEYAREQLPFGVTQVGRAYRNEISPRRGLVRVREFTQAELELFVDPAEDEPPLERVADVEVPLYSEPAQHAADGTVETVTVGEAVESGVVGSAWIGYYLGVAIDWFERIGVDMDRFRYRQHLAGERAHYAADCWDAETEVGGDWIEVTGFAYRADYDLSKHAEYGDEDFTVFKQYDESRTVERPTVEPDMSVLGPEFGGQAGAVADALQDLAERDPGAFDGKSVTVDVDGESYDVSTEAAGFTIQTVTESGEHLTPHVVEPSFGVDRLVYTVLAHAMRRDEVDGEARTVLRLPAEVAPTFVGVFPLMDKDGLGERATELAERLRSHGLSVAYDDSGSIGRRYRRQDEVGTPYGVTVDYQTLEENTVTLRDRDTAVQRRVDLEDLPALLSALRAGERAFDEVGAPVADA
mgnify:CR=1 FL=1